MKKKLAIVLALITLIMPISIYAKSSITVENKATDTAPETTCESLFGGATGKKIKDIYKLIKFIVPILFLGLSIKDFALVIVTQEGDFKKATNTFFKRLVVAIIILVAPTIVGFVLDAMGIEKCI